MRNARANMNIAPSKKASLIIVMQDESKKELFEKAAKYFISVGATTDVRFENQANIAEDAIKVVTQYANLYILTGDLIDVQKEMQRLEKEREKLLSEIDRVVKKLANESFVAKGWPGPSAAGWHRDGCWCRPAASRSRPDSSGVAGRPPGGRGGSC